jgi:hypothetical protein
MITSLEAPTMTTLTPTPSLTDADAKLAHFRLISDALALLAAKRRLDDERTVTVVGYHVVELPECITCGGTGIVSRRPCAVCS